MSSINPHHAHPTRSAIALYINDRTSQLHLHCSIALLKSALLCRYRKGRPSPSYPRAASQIPQGSSFPLYINDRTSQPHPRSPDRSPQRQLHSPEAAIAVSDRDSLRQSRKATAKPMQMLD
ncbi:MAG: hypothetical protein HC780_23525 [Leptolyngbyaceae cyanobacterium CSU_1_3]|nr:hypothetical protein [Leptolyngbyaceae cyanobacterium CSU_1_3]